MQLRFSYSSGLLRWGSAQGEAGLVPARCHSGPLCRDLDGLDHHREIETDGQRRRTAKQQMDQC